MRYARCQCGKAEAWTTDGFQACQGCDECGTTFAQSPGDHKTKSPHEWETRFSSSTGQPSHRRCVHCHKRAPLETEAAGGAS